MPDIVNTLIENAITMMATHAKNHNKHIACRDTSFGCVRIMTESACFNAIADLLTQSNYTVSVEYEDKRVIDGWVVRPYKSISVTLPESGCVLHTELSMTSKAPLEIE